MSDFTDAKGREVPRSAPKERPPSQDWDCHRCPAWEPGDEARALPTGPAPFVGPLLLKIALVGAVGIALVWFLSR